MTDTPSFVERPLHEIELTGTPGNVVAVMKRSALDGAFRGYPTKLLAWGVLDEAGKYKALILDGICEEVVIAEYDPCMAEHFKKYAHVNTED